MTAFTNKFYPMALLVFVVLSACGSKGAPNPLAQNKPPAPSQANPPSELPPTAAELAGYWVNTDSQGKPTVFKINETGEVLYSSGIIVTETSGHYDAVLPIQRRTFDQDGGHLISYFNGTSGIQYWGDAWFKHRVDGKEKVYFFKANSNRTELTLTFAEDQNLKRVFNRIPEADAKKIAADSFKRKSDSIAGYWIKEGRNPGSPALDEPLPGIMVDVFWMRARPMLDSYFAEIDDSGPEIVLKKVQLDTSLGISLKGLLPSRLFQATLTLKQEQQNQETLLVTFVDETGHEKTFKYVRCSQEDFYKR